MSENEEPKEEKNKSYELVNVPTQHTLAIQTPSGELISTEHAMVMLLNKIDDLKSLIG